MDGNEFRILCITDDAPKEYTEYHVFTDNRDLWFKDIEDAKMMLKVWYQDGNENLRLYKETYEDKEHYQKCVDGCDERFCVPAAVYRL